MPNKQSGRILFVVIALLLALPLIAAYFYLLEQQESQPVETPRSEPEPRQQTAPARVEPGADAAPEFDMEITPVLPLPELDDSDPWAITALAALSRDVIWPLWLQNEELIRKFVVAVDNIAAGRIARKYIILPAPREPFRATQRDGGYYPLAASYRRYDRYVDIFAGMDEQAVIQTYREVLPLLEEAYRELGYPAERSFHDTLLEALERLLETPPFPSGEAARLTRTSVMYKYADPELEALSPLTRQMWRLGPDNLNRVRQKLIVILELLKEIP